MGFDPEEIKQLQAVNHAARDARRIFEAELQAEPYKDHLYSEQQYDLLMVMELREINLVLSKLCQLVESLIDAHIPTPGTYEAPRIVEVNEPEKVEPRETVEEVDENEEVDVVDPAVQEEDPSVAEIDPAVYEPEKMVKKVTRRKRR